MKKHWQDLGILQVEIRRIGHIIGRFGMMSMKMDSKMLWQQGIVVFLKTMVAYKKKINILIFQI